MENVTQGYQDPILQKVLSAYDFPETLLGAVRYGQGHINDTYCVVCQPQEGDPIRFILQGMSRAAFPHPEELMENFIGITSYLRKKIIAAGGNPARETLSLVKTKNGQDFYTDENGKEYEAYGFTYGGIVEATALNKLQYSWYQTMDYVRLVRLSLQMLISGAAGVDDLSGPVGIVSTITEVGKETEAEAGFGAALESILYFAAMIAVNLAVMNLLPLPALDGGKIFFLLVNAVSMALIRKQIPLKYENYIHFAGLVLLLGLMALVTFSDVWKLFT